MSRVNKAYVWHFLPKHILWKQFQNDEKTSNEEGESQFDADAKIDTNAPKKIFTAEEIEEFLISNALLMFVAGFDTSSNAMALTR